MYQNYKRLYHGSSRPGFKSRPSGNRRRSASKDGKQNINPERFIKKASQSEAIDYVARYGFADFAIHPLIKNNVAAKGYLTPSEIQDKTIPLGLSGQDVVGVADTGTGKTAAFAIPIINKLLHQSGTQALIITPTRELAMQIEEEFKQFAHYSGLTTALLIGGLTIGRQITALKHKPHIIIGTPGRIKDHLNQRTLNLNTCNTVVLDEVDRMLDMGFINDVRFILDRLPEQRQSFFFSATLGPEISSLISNFTKEPATINVKVGETTDSVHQDIINYATNPQRIDLLHDVLIAGNVQKALVFGKTKYGVERLGKELRARGFKADSLHGGKTQGQRQRALDGFRNDRINILVATDVAARGIDVVDITHVINYDVPHSYNDYIHRIGRAGRAGKTGYALTFVEKA